jgi:ABC-type phosphate transport system substrate-binding protein
MAHRLLAGVCLLVTVLAAQAGGGNPRIAVIVHRDRRDVLDVSAVASIYLRKRRFWEDGAPIIPLNREAGSTLREAFSRRIFGTVSAQLSGYWNERYFHGVMPPATLSSSESMKRFVAQELNAVGYVELEMADASVRVALVLD